MQIALITGPSSGIGLATAHEMGARGYHVVAAGRSEERTMEVVDQINADGGSAEFLHLDLASFDSCVQAARTFANSGRTLDVLINNAGVAGRRDITEDGFEIQFGVNHLGHFMLTHHLGKTFRPHSRIVVVSSEVHRRADGIDFDKARQKPWTPGIATYAVSKLANILFARRLAELHPEWRTYSLHPGVADTNIFPPLVKPLVRNKRPATEAARTSVWCATSDDLDDETGSYYSNMKVREPSLAAQDDELARELWERSSKWCGAGQEV